MAQQEPENQQVWIPGPIVKWIYAAEPVFAKENLKVERYTVVVNERGSEVIVWLTTRTSLEEPEGFGSMGKYPDYEVTFSKKTGKVLRAHYVR